MERCEDSGLKQITLDKKFIKNVGNSSKGTQPKFFKDNIWYKQNRTGYESKAEVLCSFLLEHSNIEEFVSYQECMINGRVGCYSENFLQPGEECVSLQRLFEYHMGGKLYDAVLVHQDIEKRIEYVLQFAEKATTLDMRDYLARLLTLDMLTLNVDRHFHNICVIRKADGTYRLAPVFDNGAALLSDYGMFPIEYDLEENIGRALAAPFSANFEMQAMVSGMPLKVKRTIKDKLKLFTECRAKRVLEYQLERYSFLLN